MRSSQRIFYRDICEDRDEQYDTSDFPKDHICHSLKNKKIPGYMKDEMAGVPIAEFVGLRPKMYSVLLAERFHEKHGERNPNSLCETQHETRTV